MNNQDSLRKQIIDAMAEFGRREYGWSEDTIVAYVDDMFDVAIMPVLEAAMKAGVLLVHRATVPQKPVPDAIMQWLESCLHIVATVRPLEPTVSKRELLNMLYQLEKGAAEAVKDAKAIKPTEAVKGSRLRDKLFPTKG